MHCCNVDNYCAAPNSSLPIHLLARYNMSLNKIFSIFLLKALLEMCSQSLKENTGHRTLKLIKLRGVESSIPNHALRELYDSICVKYTTLTRTALFGLNQGIRLRYFLNIFLTTCPKFWEGRLGRWVLNLRDTYY